MGSANEREAQEAKPIEGDLPPEIEAKLNPKSNGEEEIKPSLVYNTNLLNYAGVLDIETEFTEGMLKIALILIIVIMCVSTVMLYTSFKITYQNREKELGMLTSIGMNKKQRKQIIRKEAGILGIIRNNNRDNTRNSNINVFNKRNRHIIKRLFI